MNDQLEKLSTKQKLLQRTCVGCWKTKDKSSLIRIVRAPDSSLVVDLNNQLEGRGAYICPDLGCIKKALDKKKMLKAFRKEVTLPLYKEFVENLKAGIEIKIKSLIGISNKAGKLVSGSYAAKDIIQKRKAKLVLFSKDISQKVKEEFIELVEDGVDYQSLLTKDEFGQILGKAQRGVIVIQEERFAKLINNEIKQLLNLVDKEIVD